MRPSIHALGLCVAALAAGCGGGVNATEKQLAELRAELVKLRADSAMLSERLDALERTRRAAPASAARSPAEPDRPELAVVRLDPDDRRDQGAGDTPALQTVYLEPDDAPAVLRSTRGGEVVLEQPPASGAAKAAAAKPPTTPPRRTP